MSEDLGKDFALIPGNKEEAQDSLGKQSINSNDYKSKETNKIIGTNPSIVTILSIWNTMIGSSIVTMPNCVANAGLIPTILFNIIFASICCYTCRIVVKTGGNDIDYANTVERYFGEKYGKIGRFLQILFNLAINLGATFIYFLTINQNLFPCLAILLKVCGASVDPDDITPSFSKFSLIYCGVIVCVLSFPLLIMKELKVLIKINSIGIYFVSVLLIFVMYTGVSSLFNTNFDFGYFKNGGKEPRYLYLFGPDPSILMGTLSLGYFSHSFVLPLMKNNKNKCNNTRDLLLGYLLVMTTYIVVGLLGFIGFSGKNYDFTFKDNWFRFFASDNIFILLLRLISVFQLLSVFPVLFSIVRTQFFDTFLSSGKNLISYDPTKKEIIVFSSSLSALCLIILYLFYNSLGKMLGVVGATTGLFLIYIIPLIMNFIYYKNKHESVEIYKEKYKDYQNKEKQIDENEKQNEEKQIDEKEKQNEEKQIDEKEKQNEKKEQIKKKEPTKENGEHIDDYGLSHNEPNDIKTKAFYLLEIILILFGFFTFLIQFVHINFFGIVLKDNPN